MTLIELQDLIARLYADRDARRGVDGGIESLTERVNRLSASLEDADIEKPARHLADVLVDVTSIAIGLDINLEEAVRYYVHGCPECGNNPCDCN
jgi:NTP pyrophosphatase (non-canonical NTP hydrolase)